MWARVLMVGLVCFLLGAGAAMLAVPWFKAEAADDLPPCPYLESHELTAVPPQVVTAMGAYEAIRETLMRDSLEGVRTQTEVIVRAFEPLDPKISSCAKRLADAPDVESAKRAFMRLHRLMQKHADQWPAPTAQ